MIEATKGNDLSKLRARAKEFVPTKPLTDLTPSALDTLADEIESFVGELLDSARRLKQREHAEAISSEHVTRAATYLVSKPSRKVYRFVGAIGALLLGVAIPNTLAIIDGHGGNSFTLLTYASAIAGAVLLAMQIARE